MILEAIFNGQIYPAETVVPKCKKFREVTVVSACDDIVSGNEKHISECKKFLEVTVANACYNIVSYPKVNF